MMKTLHTVRTDQAPKAVGPYAQAVCVGGFVYTAGQIPLDPGSGDLVDGSIEIQTERVMTNLKAVLEAAGTSLERVVKTTVYLTDLSAFGRFNEVYGRYFPGHKPARTTVGVAALPKGARIEVEMVAAA